MTDQAATEWLAVAAGEVRHLSRAALEVACREARRTCTHHGQILPTILSHAQSESYAAADRFIRDWNNSLRDASQGYPALASERGAGRIGDIVKRIAPR